MVNIRFLRTPGLVGVALASVVGGLAGQFRDPPPPPAYALEGVTVVRPDGRRETGVTVVVRGSLIEALAPDAEVPPGAEVLEGDSLFVYPGLIDANGKVTYEFPKHDDDDDDTVKPWDPPRWRQGFMPHRYVAHHLTATGKGLAAARKNGIVAAAVVPSGTVMPGRVATVIHRAQGEGTALIADPDVGTVFSFRAAQGVYPSTLFGVIAFLRQSFADANREGHVIEAWTRDPHGLTMPAWDPDYATLRATTEGEEPVFFEADLARDILRVLQLAGELEFSPIIVGGDEAWKVTGDLIAAGVPVLLSTDFGKPTRWKPGSEEPSDDPAVQREQERFENLYANAARLDSAGVQFALTSGGKGDLLTGARKAVEYGLNPIAALRAVTVVPAAMLHLDAVSRLEPEMAATFIVTTGDLFDEKTKVAYTFVEGVLEKGAPIRKQSAVADSTTAGAEVPAANVAGVWTLTMESPAGTLNPDITVEQTGADFTGSGELPFGPMEISGSVSGNAITFTMSIDAGDQAFEIEFSGTVTGNTASGTVALPDGSSSEWSATRKPGEAR